jgi:hypothetical protein
LDKSKIEIELIFPKQEGIQPVNPFLAIIKVYRFGKIKQISFGI